MKDRSSAKCPACGAVFVAGPAETLSDGRLKCPACGLEYPAEPSEKPASELGRGPAVRGEVLLDFCPICESGPVRTRSGGGEEQIHLCDTCASRLVENIFGFKYAKLDPRHEKRKSEFLGQTFTKPELFSSAAQVRRERETKESSAIAEASREAAAKAEEAKELWWELDQEELARRKEQPGEREPKKELTVEDLLYELKKQPKTTRPKEEK